MQCAECRELAERSCRRRADDRRIPERPRPCRRVRRVRARARDARADIDFVEATTRAVSRSRRSQGAHPKRARAAERIRSAGATRAFALDATRGGGRRHCGGEQCSDLWGAVARERIALDRRTEVVASHVRSLMPGHLTDVASTNQHNVKPWFNGRLDLSPAVPNLDSAGFPLHRRPARLSRRDARSPRVVYARRQHMINVYSWPAGGPDVRPSDKGTQKGYNLIEWRRDGVDAWVVSDLNRAELAEFVRVFTAAR